MVYKLDFIRNPPRWANTQWEDFRVGMGAFQFRGAADPSIDDWQPGGAGRSFLAYAFKTNDIVYFVIQMPHGWLQGSEIRAHVHWTPRDRGVTEDAKTVEWTLDYSWANIGDAHPASTTVDMTDTCQGVNDEHLISPTGVIDGAGKGLSSMLMCGLYKNGGTWVGNAAGTAPALLEFDIHYLRNSLGSDGEFIKLVG